MANNIVYVGSMDSDEPVCLALAGQTDPESSATIRRPKDTPIMVFQYITTGQGVVFNGNKKYKPAVNDFFIVPAHREHYYYPDSKNPWGKVWINVIGNLPEELLRVYGVSEHYYFPGCQEAGKVLTRIVNEIANLHSENVSDYISHRILEIVIILSRFCKKNHITVCYHNEAALELRDYLRSKISSPSPGLKEMSRQIGLSPVQTIRVFRKEFGTTPYAYLLDEKINVAAEMLTNAENSIKAIADILGFANEYYFSRIFKQKKGVPPGVFRQNANNQNQTKKPSNLISASRS